jgi:hypothetical protein
MAHYAFLNEHNIVTEVITGRDEWEEVDGITDWEQAYSEVRGQVCKRTSYNNNYRKNYAGVGFQYDSERDAFIAPKPFESWVLNEDTCHWEAPIAYPTDGLMYEWDETTTDWKATVNG